MKASLSIIFLVLLLLLHHAVFDWISLVWRWVWPWSSCPNDMSTRRFKLGSRAFLVIRLLNWLWNLLWQVRCNTWWNSSSINNIAVLWVTKIRLFHSRSFCCLKAFRYHSYSRLSITSIRWGHSNVRIKHLLDADHLYGWGFGLLAFYWAQLLISRFWWFSVRFLHLIELAIQIDAAHFPKAVTIS